MIVITSPYLKPGEVLVIDERDTWLVIDDPLAPAPAKFDVKPFYNFGLPMLTLTVDAMVGVHARCGTRPVYVFPCVWFCPSCRTDVRDADVLSRPHYEGGTGARARQVARPSSLLGSVGA